MIRWLIRTAIGFAGLLALAVLVGVLMVDTVARRLLESAIRAQTGLDVRIGKVEVGLIRPTLRVENLKLYSAPSFGGLVMIDMPELFVEYDRASAERRQVLLKLVRLNLAEVNIVTDSSGRTNAMEFPGVADALSKMTNQVPSNIGFEGIETLNLTLGVVKHTNLKNPDESLQIPVGLKDEVATNVRGFKDLLPLALRIATKAGRDGAIELPRPQLPRPQPPRAPAPAPSSPNP